MPDLSRLIRLLLAAKDNKHREAIERTIVNVCKKSAAASSASDADRAQPVLAILANINPSESAKYLPLLGRFGGSKVMEMINASLVNGTPEVKKAATQALCNWPTVEVADRLWTLANGDDKAVGALALRAYVRVVTLKSDRPALETLAMLQRAMKLASTPGDRQWIITRASTVRTMETVQWIAGYLDDPSVNQAACRAVVELAHHRFLRHPNMDRFGPLLEKTTRTSKDPGIVERAKKYQLGL